MEFNKNNNKWSGCKFKVKRDYGMVFGEYGFKPFQESDRKSLQNTKEIYRNSNAKKIALYKVYSFELSKKSMVGKEQNFRDYIS